VSRTPIAITRSDLTGLTWVVLHGELDLAGAGFVGGDLARICDTCEHVVVDARDLTFIDLAGLRILAGLERRQRDRGARFSLVAGDAVRRLARLGDMRSLLGSERHPDDLLGIAGLHDTGPAPEPADPGPAPPARPAALLTEPSVRELVASECARQAALVATMVSLAARAQNALDAVRDAGRASVEGRVRRATAS
jgi:anti-anti-sigma factor